MRCFLLFFLIALTSSSAQSETLFLSIGEKTYLPIPKNRRISTQDKSLFTLTEQDSLLVVRAKKQGSTFIHVGNKTYQMYILPREEKQKIHLIKKFLKPLWGLTYSFSDNKIFIKGKLNRISDWIHLSELSKKHNISYVFKAQPSEDLEKPILLFFAHKFKNTTAPRIEWSELPFVFIPEGSSEDFYKKELKPFGLIPKIDSHWKAPASFIKINIALIEITKAFSSALGGSLLSPLNFSFLDFINLLKTKGSGKVIHQASLLTQNKQTVTLHSGGHIPFLQNNLETKQQTLSWKSYGLNLNITPYLYSFKTLTLKIKWDLSEPTSLPSPRSTPPLKSHKWETELQMKIGQILKLFHQNTKGTGGLIQGGLASLIPNNLSYNKNNYNKSLFLFIQPLLLEKDNQSKNLLEFNKLKK